MTHNQSITSFSQLMRHLELEEEWHRFQIGPTAYVAEPSQHGSDKTKHVMVKKLNFEIK